ncbi:AMP-binding protein [Candidatus Dependentiae bacterium]|nr:AMP-binding protein [Candidatus Dependentiae bacterium]
MDEQHRFNELLSSLTIDNTLIHTSQILARAAALWPSKTMLLSLDEEMTYQEVNDRSLVLAHQLRSHGVKNGERVIILYENSIEFFIAYYAVWYAGGVVVPLNVFLIEHEIEHILEDSKPKVLIISPTLKEKLKQYPEEKLPPMIVGIEKTGALPPTIEKITLEHKNPHDMVAILYTSGTTGFPKGVMLSSSNILTNILQGISRFDATYDDRILCALPLFHCFPQNVCLWMSPLVGGSVIIVPKIERKALFKGAAKKPTLLIAVPALYGLICLLRIQFKGVRYFISGGDALSDKIRAYFELLYGRKLCNGYGLTETTPLISVDIDDFTQSTSTIGRPLVGISCSIRDEFNKEVARGTIGTLWVKGANIMIGYYNAPEATAAIMHEGWLNTGDLAYIDPNKKIVLAGRARDLISNKGLKIYPQEIENILLSHPSVIQAGVVGLQEGDEELPVAFVATREGPTENLIPELKKMCAHKLAPYKIPRHFYVQKELPMTATGKINKKLLREGLIKHTTS